MKYILSLCLSFFIVSMLFAKPRILATASMWADMAQVLGGDLVEVDLIVPIGSDPHLYEPTPGDVRKVQWADLILINGLTFEGWLQKLIESSGTRAIRSILTEGISPITNPSFMNSTDPHAWMDPVNGKTYANNLAKALMELDSAHAQEYKFNLEIYLQQLEDLHQYIAQRIAQIPESHRVLVTSHDAFHYFGNRYGLQVESLLGTSTDADVQTGDFLRVNQLIRERKLPAIFIESTINPKLMEQLSKENNIQIGGKLFADSLGDKDSPGGTYLNMLRNNADVIVSALTGVQTAEPNASGEQKTSGYNLYIILSVVVLLILAFLFLLKRSK